MTTEAVWPSGMTPDAAKRLREPFLPHQIGKLPRKNNNTGTTIQLDYVGHAGVTDRLLEVDPAWSWEPCAMDEDGLPRVAIRGGDAVMWIRLNVCGITRLGVGIVAKGAFELEKQLISDALRNAAMRFGVALDLWSKQDLHEVATGQAEQGSQGGSGPGTIDERPPSGNPADYPLSDLETMGAKWLLGATAAHGVKVGGTVEEMRDRLRQKVAGVGGQDDGPVVAGSPGGPSQDPPTPAVPAEQNLEFPEGEEPF